MRDAHRSPILGDSCVLGWMRVPALQAPLQLQPASQHSAAPTAVLHSPHRHQVVLHMYHPTVLNSLVLETLSTAALNNLP